jgi:dipeptidyl-peptidase-3
LTPVVREALKETVRELRQAVPFASTENQKKQLEYTIKYLEEGNVEDFRQANVEWVKDRANSTVDFMMGFVEIYEDYLGKIASWESYVQIVDPKTTELSLALAKNAQYFEDAMPYGEFKKKFPADYSPPALMVYYLQEVASLRSAGYNLPNFDDIRRDVGAKNVIKLPLPGEENDPSTKKVIEEAFREFLPAAKVEQSLAAYDKAWRIVVLLHEIIGHGSGTYDTKKYGPTEDPISALGQLGSALEEQRADLTAILFSGDSKLVDVGIYKDQADADFGRRALYDWYIGDFVRRVSRERTFTEAHQRGHWLYIHQLLEGGAIEWVARDGVSAPTPENQVLAVKDYEKFTEVTRSLLGELQRIKATRDEAGLKKLFAEHAPLEAANEPWVKALVRRGEQLAINAGAVEQPWSVSPDLKLQTHGDLTLEGAAQQWVKTRR